MAEYLIRSIPPRPDDPPPFHAEDVQGHQSTSDEAAAWLVLGRYYEDGRAPERGELVENLHGAEPIVAWESLADLGDKLDA
ncbi:hypothetical protein [Isoptericola sp. AK164]|uniref:hypothetical protein n=1 Tax=Isoptericola sp. AK164 TaxID=3024246 RepID=UPI0024188938|nr:hypothetical protein [Isoptericola sp. AK164]